MEFCRAGVIISCMAGDNTEGSPITRRQFLTGAALVAAGAALNACAPKPSEKTIFEISGEKNGGIVENPVVVFGDFTIEGVKIRTTPEYRTDGRNLTNLQLPIIVTNPVLIKAWNDERIRDKNGQYYANKISAGDGSILIDGDTWVAFSYKGKTYYAALPVCYDKNLDKITFDRKNGTVSFHNEKGPSILKIPGSVPLNTQIRVEDKQRGLILENLVLGSVR